MFPHSPLHFPSLPFSVLFNWWHLCVDWSMCPKHIFSCCPWERLSHLDEWFLSHHHMTQWPMARKPELFIFWMAIQMPLTSADNIARQHVNYWFWCVHYPLYTTIYIYMPGLPNKLIRIQILKNVVSGVRIELPALHSTTTTKMSILVNNIKEFSMEKKQRKMDIALKRLVNN